MYTLFPFRSLRTGVLTRGYDFQSIERLIKRYGDGILRVYLGMNRDWESTSFLYYSRYADPVDHINQDLQALLNLRSAWDIPIAEVKFVEQFEYRFNPLYTRLFEVSDVILPVTSKVVTDKNNLVSRTEELFLPLEKIVILGE